MALHAGRDTPTARQGSEVLEKSVDCDGDAFWRQLRRGSKPPISGCFFTYVSKWHNGFTLSGQADGMAIVNNQPDGKAHGT